MRSTILAITVSMVAVTAHGQGLPNRVTTLESDVDTIELEQTAQNGRLDALEAAPPGGAPVLQVIDGSGVTVGTFVDYGFNSKSGPIVAFNVRTPRSCLKRSSRVWFDTPVRGTTEGLQHGQTRRVIGPAMLPRLTPVLVLF